MQSANRLFGTVRLGPRLSRIAIVRDQFEAEPARVVERNRGLAKVRFHIRGHDVAVTETIPPRFERSGGDRKRARHHLARAFHADANTVSFVRKRRPDGARVASLVAVIEVIDVVVVEIDRFLHQPQTELLQTEIEIGLRVVDGGSDVMETENPRRHLSILVRARRCTAWREPGNVSACSV